MLDTYGRQVNYLRLSVTELCNLRCRYCMPEEGVCKRSHSEMLTEEEMILAVEAAAELGISKLRITGGEPLVKKNILSICSRSAAVPGIEQLCITTNATLLPELAIPLKQAGVSRVNISLDTLDRKKFEYISRRDELHRALAGLESALEAGFGKIKINAVLIGGFNDDEIVPLAELSMKHPVDVRFIEYMPMSRGGPFGPEAMISADTVKEKLPELVPLEDSDGVARLFTLPGAKGNVGLISPVSSHFCGRCNRIRITSDGKLKPCLHSSQELNIKGLDRDEMRRVMARAIAEKPAAHGCLSTESVSGAGRNMNTIGG